MAKYRFGCDLDSNKIRPDKNHLVFHIFDNLNERFRERNILNEISRALKGGSFLCILRKISSIAVFFEHWVSHKNDRYFEMKEYVSNAYRSIHKTFAVLSNACRFAICRRWNQHMKITFIYHIFQILTRCFEERCTRFRASQSLMNVILQFLFFRFCFHLINNYHNYT